MVAAPKTCHKSVLSWDSAKLHDSGGGTTRLRDTQALTPTPLTGRNSGASRESWHNEILQALAGRSLHKRLTWKNNDWVELSGLELLTSCMPYPARLSMVVSHLERVVTCICPSAPKSTLVGVADRCQQQA
jgi:hypothetical protein